MFEKLHTGQSYYLTNVYSRGVMADETWYPMNMKTPPGSPPDKSLTAAAARYLQAGTVHPPPGYAYWQGCIDTGACPGSRTCSGQTGRLDLTDKGDAGTHIPSVPFCVMSGVTQRSCDLHINPTNRRHHDNRIHMFRGNLHAGPYTEYRTKL